MKKTLIYLPLVFAALLAASCTADPLAETMAEEVFEEEGLVERSYQVCIDGNALTKSTISGNTPVWTVGDKVAVYDPVAKTSRTFNVDSCTEGRAKISGTISDGDFAFSAVYPASCVSSWTSITEPVFSAPTAQTIPADGDIAPDALVSRAYTLSPEEGITFGNSVSLVQFKVGMDGIEKVVLTPGEDGEKSYTIKLAEGTFTSGKTYYATLDPGSYSGFKAVSTTEFDISYTKTSSKAFNAKVNGQTRLGTLTDGTTKHINYSTFTNSNIPESLDGINGYLEYTGVLENETVRNLINTAAKSLYKTYVPSYDKVAHTVLFNSKSIDPKGKPVTVSTFMIYPEGTIKGIVLVSHTSVTQNSKCPTNDLQYEAALCWKGYAVVISDYYGLGSSSAYPQAFLNADVTSRGNIDALLTAKQVLADKGLAYGSEIYNLGYSQGAHAAMANVKYISQHPDCGVSFTKTFVGGGPHDMDISWDGFLSGNYNEATSYVLTAICGYIECNDLDINYSDVFQEPLLSNYKTWILSKRYSPGAITNAIGTSDLTKILTPAIIGKSGDAYESLIKVARNDSMVLGDWTPASGSKIYIYHSSKDEVIPYANKASMVNYLKAHGCTPVVDLDLVTVKEEKLYTSSLAERTIYNLAMAAASRAEVDLDNMTHVYGAIFFVADVILNRW